MTRPGDFWSRRKAKVQEEEQATARAAEARELAAREADLAEKSDEELLEELGLPDPDTLQPGDDFKAFMAKAVPDRIRRRALRRLWVSNPALANLDGLLDYGEDFTDSATVVENLQTAYQVGKGMLKHVEELARQAAAEDAPEAAPDDTPPAEDAAPDPEAPAPEALAMTGDTALHEQGAHPAYVWQEDEDDATPAPRRRMRFSFDDRSGATT